MEAIIMSSRSISHNHCFKRQSDSNYKRHMENIKLISSEKAFNLSEMTNQVEHLSELLQKSKSAAKIFRQREEKQHLKNENEHLIKKIWHLEPIVSTHNPDKFQFISGSNWTHHQKKQAEIKDQNRRMGKKMLLQYIQKQDFKSKLKAEIKDYLQLRDSIRRMKKSTDSKIKRALSQNKINLEKKKALTERKKKNKKHVHNEEDVQQEGKQQRNEKEGSS